MSSDRPENTAQSDMPGKTPNEKPSDQKSTQPADPHHEDVSANSDLYNESEVQEVIEEVSGAFESVSEEPPQLDDADAEPSEDVESDLDDLPIDVADTMEDDVASSQEDVEATPETDDQIDDNQAAEVDGEEQAAVVDTEESVAEIDLPAPLQLEPEDTPVSTPSTQAGAPSAVKSSGLRNMILVLLVGMCLGAVITVFVKGSATEDVPVTPEPVAPETVAIEDVPVVPEPLELELVVPEPLEPAPVETSPVTLEDVPVVPELAEPEPVIPEPAEPEPVIPEPAEPEQVVPEPLEPESIEPEPLEPELVEPEPLEPVSTPEEVDATTTTAEGSFRLVLTSTPDNVRVYSGHERIGRTSIDQDIVYDGEVLEIVLRKTDFEPLRIQLSAEQSAIPIHLHLSPATDDDETSQIVPTLNTIRFYVRSVPSRARVYFDEELIGRTPLATEIQVNADEVELMVRKTGYRTFRMDLTAPGPSDPIEASLVPE